MPFSSTEVHVPHLDGEVRVRPIPSKLLEVFARWARLRDGKVDVTELYAQKLAYALVDPSITLAEAHQLLRQLGPSVHLILDVIDDLSGTPDVELPQNFTAPRALRRTLRCASQVIGRTHHHRPRPGHAPRRRGCNQRRVRSGDTTSTRAGPGGEPPGSGDESSDEADHHLLHLLVEDNQAGGRR